MSPINLSYDEAGKLAILLGCCYESGELQRFFRDNDELMEDNACGYLNDPGDPAEKALHLLRKVCRAATFEWPEGIGLDLRKPR